MTRLPYNPTSGSAACEPFKPFGIEPGLVKQVREKFQSEISMRELSRNLQNGMKHHSATARLTSAYHNLLHNEGGILRHNTYPNRRIQSAGKISDSSNSTDVDIKALSKPLNVEKRSLINKNKRNTGNPENATVPIKNFLDATKSDYRPETAVFRNNSVSVCEYQDRSSHKSSGANEGTCRKSSTFPKLNGYGSKLKEKITPSKSINKPHVEFKQPVVLPKPSKSELSKDPLVNFGIPKGYQATKQSSQSIYNADEFHYTCNSSNSPNEDGRSKSPRLKFEVYSSPLNSETTCRGGTTIKIDTRTIQNAGSPTKHTESNYGYMPKNFNFPTNSNHTANESNGQPLTLGNDALPTSSKYSKELKCPLSKADAASDGTQKPPAHTQKGIVNSSAQPNGILKTSVSSVIISDPKVSSSASVSTTSSNVPSPSQSLFNIQNGNFSPHSVKKNLSNEINCNKTFVKNGEHSECEKTSDNFEKIGISFPFNGEISNKTSSPTRRITSLPHKSEFKTNTLTQVLPSHIKFNPDDVMKASVSSVETGESEKSPDFIKDSTVLERNEVKKQSHDKVAGYFSSQDAGKVHLSEFDTTPKDKIRSCSLPYHKRQVNHSVLDSVMGEMEQLFSGKQTNALSKQPRILSFAREKAMQYREEKENDLDNPAKFGNVMESTETSVNDQKTVAQNPNEHAPTASTSSKQQRQSESFQAALQAVEKNLKLTSATENNQSSNFETVANDSIKRTSRSFVTIRPGFPAVKTSLAEECNATSIMDKTPVSHSQMPIFVKIPLPTDEKFIKHQNVLNELNSTKIIPTKGSITKDNHLSEGQHNDQIIAKYEDFSDSSISDSLHSVTRSRTSFPRPQWPSMNSFMWSSNQNIKTYIQSAYNLNKTTGSTDELNPYQSTPNRQLSQSIKHFPRLTTLGISGERPKSAPVRDAYKRFTNEFKAYPVHQPSIIANGNTYMC